MAFHNIFSSSKEPKTPKPIIIIDHREKNSLVPSFLVKQGFQIQFQQLEVGDYLINNFLIERKSIGDLQSSIINKRIFQQIQQLNSQSYQPLLIIELTTGFEAIIHENALRGFFLSLSQENKIPYLFTKDEKDTSIYLSLLAKRNSNKEISLRPSMKFKTKEERMQFILEGFPGIGPKTAKKLIEKFKTLKAVFNASESELQNILGKRTEDFIALLSVQYELKDQ